MKFHDSQIKLRLKIKRGYIAQMRDEQDEQYTYNVTLWRVPVTIFATEKQKFVLCVLLGHTSVNNTQILNTA
jgi:hypothetical protein